MVDDDTVTFNSGTYSNSSNYLLRSDGSNVVVTIDSGAVLQSTNANPAFDTIRHNQQNMTVNVNGTLEHANAGDAMLFGRSDQGFVTFNISSTGTCNGNVNIDILMLSLTMQAL